MHMSDVGTPELALLGFGEEFIILGSMAEVSNSFRELVKIVFTAIRLSFISVSSEDVSKPTEPSSRRGRVWGCCQMFLICQDLDTHTS